MEHTKSPFPPTGRVAEIIPSTRDEHLYQQLLAERIVFIGSAIDDEVANRVCAQLLLLAAEDEERDIFLYINSPGGSVTAGMAVYDIMQYLPNPISTVGIGLAASMAQVLLCAGTPGRRYALRHTRVMMHQPSGGIGGTASDIRIQADQMRYVKQTFAELIARHTGQTVDQVQADWDRDRWFTAEEARRYGIVDHVVHRAAQVASEGPVS